MPFERDELQIRRRTELKRVGAQGIREVRNGSMTMTLESVEQHSIDCLVLGLLVILTTKMRMVGSACRQALDRLS